MKKTKQVIVMRKDLNMRKGKMIAQGAHASLKSIVDIMTKNDEDATMTLDVSPEHLQGWLNGNYAKICLSVGSEKDLVNIYRNAKESNIPATLIRDAGLTEFNGTPTLTCCALGPYWSEDIDKITGELKLL